MTGNINTFSLTIEAVADRLGVHPTTIRNRLKRGDHDAFAIRLGRRWRFSEAVFESHMALSG